MSKESIRRGSAGLVLAWIFATQVVSTSVFAIDGSVTGSRTLSDAPAPPVTDGTGANADVSYAEVLPEQTSLYSGLSRAPAQYLASAAIGQPPPTNYGMFYLVWHCLAPQHFNVYTNMGPIGYFTWHNQPSLGYYCFMDNPEVVRTHAVQLRDAGIDFVFVDFTNFSGGEEAVEVGAYAPFKVMVEEWAKIRGAPRIVPWLRLDGKGDFADRVDQLLDQHPEMRFVFRGKPLMMSLRSYFQSPDPATLARFSAKYTLRDEWIMGKDQKSWEFIPFCEDTDKFRASGGTIECNQRLGYGPDGMLEQVPITSAYQLSYASAPDAVPKFGGNTFLRQMERMDKPDAAGAPLVMITGWNEWIATRFCLMPDGSQSADPTCAGGSPTLPNGNPVFVDQYEDNFNRDLEPAVSYGNKYYDLLVGNVLGRKRDRGQVIGYVDSVTPLKDGGAIVNGWACQTGYSDSITVQIYANGPAGQGEFVVGGVTNLDSGPLGDEPVGRACQDGVVGNHRFAFPVDPEQARRLAHQTVYAHGVALTKEGVKAKENYLLSNSGAIDFTGKVTGSGRSLASLSLGTSQPIYRFRAASNSRHFLTASYGEGVQTGLIPEGVAFRLAPLGTPGTVPVYRCNAAGNFLSLDVRCESTNKNQNILEGPLGGIALNPAPGLVPVWRIYNPAAHDHIATTSAAETHARGYRAEFTLGYVAP